jgi:hypothetical protein
MVANWPLAANSPFKRTPELIQSIELRAAAPGQPRQKDMDFGSQALAFIEPIWQGALSSSSQMGRLP